jgi:hypothetical protein
MSSELGATTVTPADGLPGYELLDVIGCGGVGTVHRARQLKLDRLVAVKTIRPDRADAPSLAARFAAEAVMLGRLCHPNIVQLHDYGGHCSRLFIVMELLEGEDLDRRIERLGPCSEQFAWSVVRQAAAGLSHAAAHGIVHRDIKPSNLFLTVPPSGAGFVLDVPLVKVMDFGLAKWTVGSADEHLTTPGTLLGTPVYMAPEQYRRAGETDHRADIYSLGATVYHALAGEPPFDGSTVWDIMAQKLARTPVLQPPVSQGSAELVAAMMSTDPAERIGTYEELITRIDRLLALPDPPSTPATIPTLEGEDERPRRRRPALRIAVVSGLLLATGVGLWSAWDAPAVGTLCGGLPDQVFAPPVLEPTGEYALFKGNLNGWLTTDGVWHPDEDEEGVKVLTGNGTVRRTFNPEADYRVTIGLDVYEAQAAEVQFGIASDGSRCVLRVSKGADAVFGIRDGKTGKFRGSGTPVPFPPPTWFKGRRPYLEVKFERVGDRWTAWFIGREAGSIAGPRSRSEELRLVAENGRSASLRWCSPRSGCGTRSEDAKSESREEPQINAEDADRTEDRRVLTGFTG